MVTTLAVSTNLTYLTVAEEPLLLFTLIKSTVASTMADMSIAQLGLSTIARLVRSLVQGKNNFWFDQYKICNQVVGNI